ncbi:MAG: hypothetical protein RR277_02280, partial [Rikenellaceae bacterium]
DNDKEIIKIWEDKIFGCDRCISVCPWNMKALRNISIEKDKSRKRLLNSVVLQNDISYWATIDKATFDKNYSILPIKRAGHQKIEQTISVLKEKALEKYPKV